jgi:hypothetical protein
MSGFKWLAPIELSNLLVDSVRKGSPFSMLRFGDGEYEVSKYLFGLSTEKEVRLRFSRWFGNQELSTQEIRLLSELILVAYQNCNLLGIPNFKEAYTYPKWKGIEGFLRVHKVYPKTSFYFYDIYRLWRDFPTFDRILRNRKEVLLITSRHVKDELQKRFKIGKVHEFILPPEFFLWKGKDAGVEKYIHSYDGPDHFPTLFTKIRSWIKQNTPLNGKLFLVGGGGLGKIYCNDIRKAGGMALDIGAMFDGWAGITTRPYLQPGHIFNLKTKGVKQ